MLLPAFLSKMVTGWEKEWRVGLCWGGGEWCKMKLHCINERERERKSLRLSFVLSAFTLIYRHYPLNIRTLHCSSLSATTMVKQILQHVFTKHLLTSDQLVSIEGMTFFKTFYFNQFFVIKIWRHWPAKVFLNWTSHSNTALRKFNKDTRKIHIFMSIDFLVPRNKCSSFNNTEKLKIYNQKHLLLSI